MKIGETWYEINDFDGVNECQIVDILEDGCIRISKNGIVSQVKRHHKNLYETEGSAWGAYLQELMKDFRKQIEKIERVQTKMLEYYEDMFEENKRLTRGVEDDE